MKEGTGHRMAGDGIPGTLVADAMMDVNDCFFDVRLLFGDLVIRGHRNRSLTSISKYDRARVGKALTDLIHGRHMAVGGVDVVDDALRLGCTIGVHSEEAGMDWMLVKD